jgi:hypothetical protein
MPFRVCLTTDIADMADKGCTIDNGGLEYKLFLLSKAW